MSDDIRMGIRQLIKNDIKSNLYIVQVTSVDTNENTCEGTTSLAESDIPLTNIKLSTAANDGFILYPAVDSTILVIKNITDNSYYMIAHEDLQEISINVTNNIVNANQTTFNGGNNKGMVKAPILTYYLNNIIYLENAMLKTLKMIGNLTPAVDPVTTMANVNLIISAALTYVGSYSVLDSIKVEDISNPNVTH